MMFFLGFGLEGSSIGTNSYSVVGAGHWYKRNGSLRWGYGSPERRMDGLPQGINRKAIELENEIIILFSFLGDIDGIKLKFIK